MKIFPITSDDKRVPRIANILQGLLESGNNAVIFRNVPEVLFQFYLGLYLEIPTFVLIQRRDYTGVLGILFDNPLVKVTVVDEFNEKAIDEFMKVLQEGIKK